MEQGRVISNPLTAPQTRGQANTQTQPSLNPAATQFLPGTAGIPYNNPYFEMNNLRYQMSGLGGYGACTGNPFLTPNHFVQPTNNSTSSPYRRPEKKNVQTNTTLHQTNRATKSRDKTTISRDQGTETTLVLGSKKRNRKRKPPAKRQTEYLAAPGAERNQFLEIKKRNSPETSVETQQRESEAAKKTGLAETAPEEQLVLEIKVENSGELILDSMRESPAGMTFEEQAQSDLCNINSSTQKTSQELLKQPTFAQIVAGDQATDTPIKTTKIEDIFTEEQEATESSPREQAQSPVTPLTPFTPLTPLSPGFEWCEEYEYELVDPTEQEIPEEEEALDIELNFDLDLDSPQSVSSPISTE